MEKPITSEELDEVLENWVMSEQVDQDALDKQQDQIIAAIKGSKKAREAMQGSVFHIATQGPEHIGCGLTQSVAAFFVVAMKLAEARHKSKKDIEELNRIMGLAPEAEA